MDDTLKAAILYHHAPCPVQRGTLGYICAKNWTRLYRLSRLLFRSRQDCCTRVFSNSYALRQVWMCRPRALSIQKWRLRVCGRPGACSWGVYFL